MKSCLLSQEKSNACGTTEKKISKEIPYDLKIEENEVKKSR